MEEQNWVRLTGTNEMQYTVRASSEGRGWTGLDANLFETSGGLIAFPDAARYNVSMHIGAPVVATCRCDGPIQRRLQTAGDIDIVPLGYPATWEDDGPSNFLSISLKPSLVRWAAREMGVNSDIVQVPPQLQLRDPKVEHIAWALKAELEADDHHDRLYAEGLGLALAAHMLRRYGRDASETPKRGLTRRQQQSVSEYINDHLAKNLMLAEVAAVTGVSASHFKVLFKQSFGLPVHKYIIQRRVEHAVELLSRGRLRLSEVALQSGFADQSHMSRCMRRVIGMTPAAVIRSVG